MFASVKASNLRVVKEGNVILDDVNFSVQPGVIVGLIGPSGSGKTTLMRSIVGVQQIKGGSLEILGDPAGSACVRPKLGYVPQNLSIYDDLTVQQNLKYFARLVRAHPRQIEEILHTVRLQDKRNMVVEKLSGGQRARVSLAVALLGDPELLILDEPTVGLDPLLRLELWELFEELAKQGKTLLVSSHVMDEAEHCRYILLMRDGQLVWSGPKSELLSTTRTKSVEAAFLSIIRKQEHKNVSR